MLTLKCQNCGGEMSVDGSGLLFCEYCGNKYSFDDSQLTEYRNFRKEMLNFLRGVHDEKAEGEGNEEYLWNSAETVVLKSESGDDITINYLFSHDDKTAVTYMTRKNVVLVFDEKNSAKAEEVLQGIRKVTFPAADVKGLSDCFPKFVGKYNLSDKGVMLAFERSKNLFPLSMFGSLEPEHVAWVISRLENICCVLNYSEIIHGNITEDNIWINPFTHHAVLQGGWYSVKESANAGFADKDKDLKDLRKTAERVLGIHNEEAPKEMTEFLKSVPKKDAYEDFEAWDKVIEEGFGGRRFAKMDVNF